MGAERRAVAHRYFEKGETMMDERDFVIFLREIVRMAEGDEMVKKLDRLAQMQKEMFALMNDQKEIPAELVKEWNDIIKELYPEGHD
jgi:hypothetical protein